MDDTARVSRDMEPVPTGKLMRDEEIPRLGKNEAEAILRTGNPYEVSKALLSSALYSTNRKWAEERCITFLANPDLGVRSTAITCLGHLARLHGVLDLERIIPLLQELKNDSRLKGRIEDTLDDIKIFIK